MANEFKIQIWGTRGSMTAPYPNRMQYGANTSCVSAEWDEGMVIFDCGSGIRLLGEKLLRRDWHGKKIIHVFLSHLHLDHIIGLPFFPLIYNKEWTIHLYGFSEKKGTFKKNLTEILSPPYWPVPLERAGAEILWHEIKVGDPILLADNVKVKTIRSNHPDATILMRLEGERSSFVYGLDCELTEDYQEQYECFVQNCSLLLFDGMYCMKEMDQYRGFGHSTWEHALEIQEKCHVGQVCISHHDWSRTDDELTAIEKHISEMNANCVLAKEGMEYII